MNGIKKTFQYLILIVVGGAAFMTTLVGILYVEGTTLERIIRPVWAVGSAVVIFLIFFLTNSIFIESEESPDSREKRSKLYRRIGMAFLLMFSAIVIAWFFASFCIHNVHGSGSAALGVEAIIGAGLIFCLLSTLTFFIAAKRKQVILQSSSKVDNNSFPRQRRMDYLVILAIPLLILAVDFIVGLLIIGPIYIYCFKPYLLLF